MRLLLYKDLDIRRVKAAFAKVRAAIEAGDFRSADVKSKRSFNPVFHSPVGTRKLRVHIQLRGQVCP